MCVESSEEWMEKLACCENCGRGVVVEGWNSGVMGADGKVYCGLNCEQSCLLDATGSRWKDKKATARKRRGGSGGREGVSTDAVLYKVRVFQDSVDESSNALFMYHINHCGATSFRSRDCAGRLAQYT
uniref:Uncharacterized protein n=1 Tax=Compsopogon caeruleus TaxID=31354 RepID=A0A7S1T649_9RHOD|mmetsp:Transcript_11457/g.23247  ORF Transcript_11457/g.23247 Transcript_11457/m.23247 type:complete len:128 (+) Transcript_11457:97-480(+)